MDDVRLMFAVARKACCSWGIQLEIPMTAGEESLISHRGLRYLTPSP